MIKFFLRRFFSLIPVIIIISIMLFGIFKAMPGDPVKLMIPAGVKTEELRQYYYDTIKARLGLDKSLPEQYVRWMYNTMQGDFGVSTSFQRPVTEVIATPLVNSIRLNVFVLVFSFVGVHSCGHSLCC
jgi:peptide/nickel transport system permease protein